MKKLPLCLDCNKKLSDYGVKRCQSCEMKRRWAGNIITPNQKGSKHPAWKGGPPICIDCGETIKLYIAKRCNTCWQKVKEKPGIFRVDQVSGENNWNWKGGVTPLHLKIRHSIEMQNWRKTVFERDNYTCQICGIRGSVKLNADHIKPFALYPKLRFDLNNGRTLCVECHRGTDTYGVKFKQVTRSL